MKKFADNTLSNVGELRKFSFNEFNYEIAEILDRPDISITYNWEGTVCPHCKNKIDRMINHVFYKIEILIPENKIIDSIKRDDIVIVGDTLDNRKLLLDNTEYNKIFFKSKLFKKFEVK